MQFKSQSYTSIPCHGTARIAPLIPLQGIGQHTGKGTDAEVVRSERPEHQTATHGKAMEVASDIDSRHGHLLLREIITR